MFLLRQLAFKGSHNAILCYPTSRQSHIKKLYLHAQNTDYYSFSTTLRAHLFGKIEVPSYPSWRYLVGIVAGYR